MPAPPSGPVTCRQVTVSVSGASSSGCPEPRAEAPPSPIPSPARRPGSPGRERQRVVADLARIGVHGDRVERRRGRGRGHDQTEGSPRGPGERAPARRALATEVKPPGGPARPRVIAIAQPDPVTSTPARPGRHRSGNSPTRSRRARCRTRSPSAGRTRPRRSRVDANRTGCAGPRSTNDSYPLGQPKAIPANRARSPSASRNRPPPATRHPRCVAGTATIDRAVPAAPDVAAIAGIGGAHRRRPGTSDENGTLHDVLAPLPASRHDPAGPKLTVPVGGLAPDAAVSATVAVHRLTSPGATVPERT